MPASISQAALLAALCLGTALSAVSAPSRPAPAPAAQASGRAETLDHNTIHGQYNEGNFDAVIGSLEGFMKRNKSWSHDDSVFIAKHLAVVYTANPATREKGKYFMHRLLELVPSAKLVDMYVSEEIDRIFDKIKEEFLSRHHISPQDTAARTARTGTAKGNDPAGTRSGAEGPKEKKRSSAGFWIAGGAAVVAAGATAAYVIHMQEEEADRSFRVPKSE